MTTNPPHITGGLDMDAIYHRRPTPAPATTMPATTATPAHLHNRRGRALGATAAAVLAAVRRYPNGVTRTGLVGDLDRLPDNLDKTLSNLRQQGYLVNLAKHGASAVWVCQNHHKALAALAASQDEATAHHLRHTAMAHANGGRTVSHKGPDRVAVEAALLATGTNGKTCAQLAEASGVDAERVANVLRNMQAKGLITGQHDGPPGTNVAYVLTAALVKAAAPASRTTPLRNSTTTEKNWCPPWLRTSAINHSDRPGAQDAFTLPSVVGGVRTPHKTPASMGTGAGNSALAIGSGRRFAE